MKRRGGRVVSSGSTVVGAAGQAAAGAGNGLAAHPLATASPTAAHAPSASAVSPEVNGGDVAPTLVIPTLDIFARFQGKRDDFDADWLMLQEDPAARDEAPPIAAHVADKLRRHQAQLGAHRAAAAAERARQDRVGGTAAAGGSATAAAARPPRRPRRRPDAYDSAEEEAEGEAEEVGERPRAVEELDDEAEYVPEDRAAVQYAAAAARRPAGGSDAPRTDAARRTKADAAASRRTATAAGATSPAVSPAPSSPVVPSDTVVEAEAEAGLIGDFLNFTAQPGSKVLDASALQATVHVPSDGSPQQPQRRQQQQPPRHRRADKVLVVPLWSSARVTQHGGYCRTSPLIALHQEVMDLVDYLRPTEAEVAMRRYIEKQLNQLVDRLWPGSSVLVYGSMYTHLLLPLSDLDMTLVGVPVPPEEALTVLAKEVSDAGLCENTYPQVILKTKVPLIKFVHKGSLIDVDISVGALDGKRNSDCVLRYLRTYPEALPLTLVVKYFVMQRGMHEPYHGGLGSYAATLLVVAFLRQHPIYTTELDQRPMTGLGKLLVDFFRMCGQYWNFGRVAVCLEPYAVASVGADGGEGDFRVRVECGGSGGRHLLLAPSSPSSPRGPLGPAQACIEDPVDPANNAASSLRLFHAVASMFANAYYTLTADFADAAAAAAAAASPTGVPAPQPGTSACSPSSEDISQRPTLLSRIFHVDADMVYRRQAMAATYERLCREMPAYMQAVRDFHAEEDAAMLQRNCGSAAHSWAAQRLHQRRRHASGNGDEDASTSLFPEQRPVTSLEERLALTRLHTTTTSSSSPTSGNDAAGRSHKRRREHAVASSSSSSRSSRSRSPSRSDSGSSASSVRVDVSRTTERSRRLRR